MKSKLYLAAYDIGSPRRLQTALYLLKGFACGRQKSVFECFLTQAEHRELIDAMNQIMEPAEDRFLLLPLASAGDIKTLGKGVAPADQPYLYIG